MPTKSAPASAPETLESKLDKIVLHLERLDKRDRWRTIGGFFKFLVSLIPVLFLLGSAWYFLQHSGDIMKMIADQAASAASKYTQNQSQGMFDTLMKQVAPKK
jgi:ATP-dependent Zn protease